MCIDSIPRCELEFSHTTVITFPGQTHTIPMVAVGQRFGTVVTTVQAQFITSSDKSEQNGEIAQKEYVQDVGTTCTDVSLTVTSLKKMEQLILTPVNYNSYAIGILKIALNQSRMQISFLTLSYSLESSRLPFSFKHAHGDFT